MAQHVNFAHQEHMLVLKTQMEKLAHNVVLIALHVIIHNALLAWMDIMIMLVVAPHALTTVLFVMMFNHAKFVLMDFSFQLSPKMMQGTSNIAIYVNNAPANASPAFKMQTNATAVPRAESQKVLLALQD